MPRSQRPNTYPREFAMLLERAAVAAEPVRVAIGDRKKALSLRGKLYGFVAALRRYPEDFPETLFFADQLVFAVTEGGDLEIYNKEQSWDATMIREMLGTKTTQEEARESQERLMEKMHKRGEDAAAKHTTYEEARRVAGRVVGTMGDEVAPTRPERPPEGMTREEAEAAVARQKESLEKLSKKLEGGKNEKV